MRLRRAPPRRVHTGTPSSLPRMSHSAMSSPLSACMTGPERPKPCRTRSMRAVSSLSAASCPIARCLIQLSNAAGMVEPLLP
jgi:hypothetical protein